MAEGWDDGDADNVLDDLLAEDDLEFLPESPTGGEAEEKKDKEAGAGANDAKGSTSLEAAVPDEPQAQVAALPPEEAKPCNEGPSCKENAGGVSATGQPTRVPASLPHPQEEEVHSRTGIIRYFIMKSITSANIEKSMEHGVWSTQAHNENKLNHAFQESDEVRLIFSVNQSGHFQGYARMASPIGRGPKSNLWVGSSWGCLFQVDWQCRYDLSFYKVEHLVNPLNEGKPVKIAKDGQEVSRDVGDKLVKMMEDGARQSGGNPLRSEGHRPIHWWPGQGGYKQRPGPRMGQMGPGSDQPREWRHNQVQPGVDASMQAPANGHEADSLAVASRARVRSRSCESSHGPGSPKRPRRSTQGSPGGMGSHGSVREPAGHGDPSPGRGSLQPEGSAPHVFDLTYDQYLDYYCRVQSRISELYSSGQLFEGSRRGSRHEVEGNGHFSRSSATHVSPSFGNGRPGPSAMSEE
ncbi:unnamed protein product, partial [Ostreobium quekettii]